jgi:hypothetical protein
MRGYQTEAGAIANQNGSRLGRTCSVIRTTAMCLAAIVPMALLAGTKYVPAGRSEDTTLIKSILEGKVTPTVVMAWVESHK